MIDRPSPSTPPPEEATPSSPKIKYKKKARHGHGNDVTDENNIRQVAGCLPIDPYAKRFLLVSSSKNPEQWVIPKGGWESDETQEQAALRETWEEAGIKGKITHQLGIFVERSNKKIRAHHWIFELEIRKICKKYPERKKRDRRWFTFEEALIAVGHNDYLREAIKKSTISPDQTFLSPRSSPRISPISSFDNDSSAPTLELNNKSHNLSIVVSPPTSRKAFGKLTELMEKVDLS